MKAILAIAQTEVLKSWKLVIVPLAAILSVLALSISGTTPSDPSFRGNLMGILTLLVFPLAAVPAAVLGLNLFGPEIKQRRLSFFFTRPCAPWQLWLGRLLGASLVTFAGWFGGAVALPLMGVPGIVTLGAGVFGIVNAFIHVAVLAGVLLLMNALAMILAANASRWFVADVVAGLAFLAALVWSFGRALQFADAGYVEGAAYAVALFAVVALFFAGVAFLTFGRGDGALGHQAHSITLWSFGVLAILSLGAHRAYEWSRPPGNGLSPMGAKSAGPSKAVVTFYGRRILRVFLLDTRTGEARRVSASASGRFADLTSGPMTYLEPRFDPFGPKFLSHHLVVSSSDPGGSPLVDRKAPPWFRWLLDASDGGEFAIFATLNGVEVIRTQTGASQFRYPVMDLRWAAFQSNGTIAVMAADGPSTARLSVLTMDGKLVRERKFQVASPPWYSKLHAESGRMAIAEGPRGVTVYESDGTLVAHLPPESVPGSPTFRGEAAVSPSSVFFTRAGDLLLVGARGVRALRHGEAAVRDVPFSTDGVALPQGHGRWIGGELESGELVMFERPALTGAGPHLDRGEGSSLIVEPLTGVVRQRLKDFRPLDRGDHQGVTSASQPSQDSSLRLFRNAVGDLVFLDPGSAKPRLLVKSSSEDR